MYLINKTRNGKRRLFKREENRRNEYIVNGKIWAASNCQERLNSYTEVLEKEVTVFNVWWVQNG
jgi:hypothetical protein